MRWRWPPENSCGKRCACSGARPTSRSSSAMRCARACPVPWPGHASAAPRPGCRATRIFGFRLAYGSWKIICSLLRSVRMRLPLDSAEVLAAVRAPGRRWRRSGAATRARWCSCPSPTRRPGRASRRVRSRTTRRPPRAPGATLAAKNLRRLRTSISGVAALIGQPAASHCELRAPRPARRAFGVRERAGDGGSCSALVAGAARAAAGVWPVAARASRRGRRPAPGRSAARRRSRAAARAGSTPGRGSRTAALAGRGCPAACCLPGRQASRPCVYGWRGARTARRTGARLDDAAGVHHRHVVGVMRHHAEVVRDEQDAHAGLGLQAAHQRQDLRLDRHVERGGRLVGDQQRRVAGHRQRDHHALAHAAGELVRILVAGAAPRPESPPARACAAPAARAAARSRPLCSRSDSAICSPMLNTGFRLVIGSWKIIATSLPRSARMRGSGSASRSSVSPARSTNRRFAADLRVPPCAAAGASASGW